MLDCEPDTGSWARIPHANNLEKIMLLPDMLKECDVSQLLDFADSLDPNSGWRESVAEDESITRDALYWSMLAAYDDADTHAWINK